MESLEGKKFVITGNVHIFSNRDEFKQYVTKHGGKVIVRISKNADYLVANDRESGTIKISEAEEAGVPIISERKFIKMFGDFPYYFNISSQMEVNEAARIINDSYNQML